MFCLFSLYFILRFCILLYHYSVLHFMLERKIWDKSTEFNFWNFWYTFEVSWNKQDKSASYCKKPIMWLAFSHLAVIILRYISIMEFFRLHFELLKCLKFVNFILIRLKCFFKSKNNSGLKWTQEVKTKFQSVIFAL